MTLRARLILALLAVALIPAGIFTFFTFQQLNRAMNQWYRPGVERALASGLDVSREAVTRLEATVLLHAGDWAADWPGDRFATETRSRVEGWLSSAGLDFIQVYRRTAGGWIRTAQVAPQEVLVIDRLDLSEELPPTIESMQLLRSSTGALAGLAPLDEDGVLVAGIRLTSDFFARAGDVADGITYYRQMAMFLDVQRPIVWILLASVVLGLVILAVLLATAFAREMSRPLDELSAATESVAKGDLTVRVTPHGPREIRSLGTSFNTMTERLAAALEALQRAEREAAWRDVARKLAHEFKNMLTPMQLSLQVLDRQASDSAPDRPPAMRENVSAALREVGHLGRLAEQFSQYARLPEPQLERLDLVEVVRAAAQAQNPAGFRIEVADAAPAFVSGDRLLLLRAFHNLLLNACEASPPGSVVEMRAATRGREAVVEILDRGSGLPAELGGRVFDPYVSTKRRGSGLGLSLVRDIAQQHGGEVTIQNREGGGACARFVLPLAANERDAPPRS